MASGSYRNASSTQNNRARTSRQDRAGALNSRMDRTGRARTNSRGSARPFYGQAAPELRPDYESDVRVIRTGGRVQTAQQPALVSTAVKMLALIIVLVAALSFVRIMLTSSAVTTMIESDAISTQISEARSTGTSLEMEQSVLKSPSAVKAQAKKMGMAAPYESSTIMLEPDVVAIENGDTLSLSGTIKNVVQNKQ